MLALGNASNVQFLSSGKFVQYIGSNRLSTSSPKDLLWEQALKLELKQNKKGSQFYNYYPVEVVLINVNIVSVQQST